MKLLQHQFLELQLTNIINNNKMYLEITIDYDENYYEINIILYHKN